MKTVVRRVKTEKEAREQYDVFARQYHLAHNLAAEAKALQMYLMHCEAHDEAVARGLGVLVEQETP